MYAEAGACICACGREYEDVYMHGCMLKKEGKIRFTGDASWHCFMESRMLKQFLPVEHLIQRETTRLCL